MSPSPPPPRPWREVFVALQPNLNKVVVVQMDNKATVEVFEPVMNLGLDGCRVIAKHMREAMLQQTRELATSRAIEKY